MVRCLITSMVLLWALLSHLSWLILSWDIMKTHGLKTIKVILFFSIVHIWTIHFVFSTLRMRPNYFLTFLICNILLSNSLCKETNKILASLDVCIENNDPSCLKTSTYRKKTLTGLLTNVSSALLPFLIKLGSSVL